VWLTRRREEQIIAEHKDIQKGLKQKLEALQREPAAAPSAYALFSPSPGIRNSLSPLSFCLYLFFFFT
jgi:hypothetical protein